MRALLFNVNAVAMDRGTIQRARASLTVVPIAKATAPYFAVAPTTELVSWIASADQSPNCDCVMWSASPTTGNRNSAMELRMKTVPRETAISSSLASAIGATAAMALPPQIAVPAAIKNEDFLLTRMRYPRASPISITDVMLRAV